MMSLSTPSLKFVKGLSSDDELSFMNKNSANSQQNMKLFLGLYIEAKEGV